MEEKTFMHEGAVLVSSTRIELDGQTFATRNVGSVKVVRPGMSILGALVAVLGVVALASGSIGVGMFLAVVGGVWAYTTWRRCELHLMAGGGEVVALQSSDSTQMERIREAIAQAISVR
jgi:hypothetical protein